jgi:hypothetical protein
MVTRERGLQRLTERGGRLATSSAGRSACIWQRSVASEYDVIPGGALFPNITNHFSKNIGCFINILPNITIIL